MPIQVSLNVLLVLALCTVCAGNAVAQASCLRDALGTMRCNDGSSYRVDGLGVARDLSGDNLTLQNNGLLPNTLLQPTPDQLEVPPLPVPERSRRLGLPAGCTYDVLGRFTC